MTTTAPTPHRPGTPEHALAVALAAEAAADDLISRTEAADAVHAARLAMLEQWAAYQWKQAARWWVANSRRGELDDYHAAVRAGWWEAALRWRPEYGTRYSTYAARYSLKWLSPTAHAESCGLIRVPMNQSATVAPLVLSFSGVTAGGEGDNGPFEGTLPGPDVERKPDPTGVWAAVCGALEDARERQVVWMRYGLGASLEEIGKVLGVSKERVRQLQERALGRLRERPGAFAEWRGEDAA